METKRHLEEMGKRIAMIRNIRKLNQVEFYHSLYPEEIMIGENFKKKMNAIEKGKLKRVNIDLLLRICDIYDVSLDYLVGISDVYASYDTQKASAFTGMSNEAISQLHFWKKYKDLTIPFLPENHSQEQREAYLSTISRKEEAQWILDIVNALFEKKNQKEEETGISDLSVLYDLYMITQESPETIKGIPQNEFVEGAHYVIDIDPATVRFVDKMHEIHPINVKNIYRQIWNERLLNDVSEFASEVTNKRKFDKNKEK